MFGVNVLENIEIGCAVDNAGDRLSIVATRHDRDWPGTQSPVTFAVNSKDAAIGFYNEAECWQFLTRPVFMRTQISPLGDVTQERYIGLGLPDGQVSKYSAGEIGMLGSGSDTTRQLVEHARASVAAPAPAAVAPVAAASDPEWSAMVARANAIAAADREASQTVAGIASIDGKAAEAAIHAAEAADAGTETQDAYIERAAATMAAMIRQRAAELVAAA